MRSTRLINIASIIAIAAAVALGIGAWLYHQQSSQLKARNTELQQTEQALDQSAKLAREQTEALNDAIKNSQQHQQELNVRSQRAALLANGLNVANSVKVAMAESYMTNLKWPNSNKDAGVPGPSEFNTEGVRGIAIQPNGKIHLTLIDADGKQEQLWLIGSVNAAMQVLWRCTTDDIPDIAQLIPTCRYDGK